MPSLAPQPLQGVRVTDLTWLLASAGTTTILASLGAEVIRLEWPERLDFTPNPPKDTDGRREDSGRGWMRELQGRWPGVLG